MQRADAVVAGGGAIGLSIAWRLSISGLNVVVCDPRVGRGATWAAAGMLAPASEAHYGEEALLALTLASARLYPSFVEELAEASGMEPGYRDCGTVVVARDADDNAAIEELYRFQKRLGLDVERLNSRDCRRLVPGLAPSVRGGIRAGHDHQIDNRALVEALEEACRRAGVKLLAEAVDSVIVVDERASGVRTSSGDEIEAGAVVVAAGCRSGSLEGVPEGALPVRPVKGQLLYLGGPADQPIAPLNVRGLEVYIVPRADGRVVVGATVEERGFDERATAGAVHDLLRWAYELLPGITELELIEVAVGLRPGSPDNAPMLGETGVDGLVAATGHYRNGILLTPITAVTLTELITTGRTPEVMAPFSPVRFAREALA